ncbi:ATP-binding protein [Patescibacteria group bacterium]|nr:ATP-binding protein [Patescibacteria group bacterium]
MTRPEGEFQPQASEIDRSSSFLIDQSSPNSEIPVPLEDMTREVPTGVLEIEPVSGGSQDEITGNPEGLSQEEIALEAFRRSPMGLGLINPEGRFLSTNPKLDEMLRFMQGQEGPDTLHFTVAGALAEFKGGRQEPVILRKSYDAGKRWIELGFYNVGTIEDPLIQTQFREIQQQIEIEGVVRHDVMGAMGSPYGISQLEQRVVKRTSEKVAGLLNRLQDLTEGLPEGKKEEILIELHEINRDLALAEKQVDSIVAGMKNLRQIADARLQSPIGESEVRQPLQIMELLSRLIDGKREELEEEGIYLYIDFPKDLPLVSGDPAALLTSYNHVINNAIQAIQQRQKIYEEEKNKIMESNLPEEMKQHLVEAEKPEKRLSFELRYLKKTSRIQILIADTGGGIPEEIRKRIFEKRERGVTTKKGSIFEAKGIGGQGIGVISTIATMEAHGATITYFSETEDMLKAERTRAYFLQPGTVVRITHPIYKEDKRFKEPEEEIPEDLGPKEEKDQEEKG